MKAVIMAGGEGRRLRCVTGDSPKPLVPLLGRPMMEHILLLLRAHGFREVCAALGYRAEAIRERFGDGGALGLRLCYRAEDTPLGTAGGVKNCADFIGGEDVLVISGDAACDFDLAALAAEHRKRGAAVTLALYRHPEPLSYGLTVTDSEGWVRAFIEKPDWGHVVTDLVNTGIYVLSPRALEAIPAGQPFDFARDLFPLLLRRGEKLLGVAMEGYWCDVGTPLAYYQCCADALLGRLRLSPGEGFALPASAQETSEAGDGLSCSCRDRACLMGTLSELLLDMGAEFSDGIRLAGPRWAMHIYPESARSAIRIAVQAEDAEFARSLALSAKDLAEKLDL